MKKRRVEVTYETEVSVAVRGGGARPDEACWCGGTLVTPEAAARAASVSVRAIYRLIEAASVHFTDEREPRVCARSLGGIEEG